MIGIGSNYHYHNSTKLPLYFKTAKKRLSKHESEFDAIACIGVSGLLLAPALALTFKKNLIVFRKYEDTNNHSDSNVEGAVNSNDRVLLLDDLIGLGHTMDGMWDRIDEINSLHGISLTVIGNYLYQDDTLSIGKGLK